jgi:hypothetical protein
LHLERLHDERELVDPLGRKFVEFHVLEQMHAVNDQGDLMHREAGVGRLGGCYLHRPVVGTQQERLLLDEPLGRGDADPGAGLEVGRYPFPRACPTPCE